VHARDRLLTNDDNISRYFELGVETNAFSWYKTHPSRANYDPWFNVAVEKAKVSMYSRVYATNGSIWLRLRAAGNCECGIEPSGSVKCGEFLTS
jgi:hypothetical protein